MDWDELPGTDRVRYCGKCRLNVYNLAEMPREEVEALIRKTEGRLCGRLYMRGDRKAMLRDCGGGRLRQFLGQSWVIAAIFFLGIFGLVARSFDGPDRSKLPRWARAVLSIIDPERCSAVVGALPPRAPIAPPRGATN